MLRPWDNVPRKALAQEITGNRLVYGNYVQNFDLTGPYSDLEIKPRINVILEAKDAPLNAPEGTSDEPLNGEDNVEGFALPGKTARSLRTYQLGVVYGDEYGRETPVLAGEGGTGSLTIDVKNSSTLNKLRADIGTEAPSFAHYFKYYIKETSNEYYNLAMDRWYDAEDGNIWLSFASADRNKLDMEMFIILKKKHDKHEPVVDPARYKVLAIENSAPDFIKTNIKSLGQAKNRSGNNDIGSAAFGFPFENYDEIWVNPSATDASRWFNSSITELLPKITAGTLYMRIRTSTIKSNWYQVTTLKLDGSYKFKSDKPFKEDVLFASTANSWSSRINGLRVELADFVVENKKEFEGRYFVKIYKDLVLIQNLLQAVEPEYKVLQARQLGYCNMPSHRFNKLSNGTLANWEMSNLIMQGDMSAPGNPNGYSGGGCCLGGGSACGTALEGGSGKNNMHFFKNMMGGWGNTPNGSCPTYDGVKSWMQKSEGRFHIDAMWVRGAQKCDGCNCCASRESLCDSCDTCATRGRGVTGANMNQMDIGYIYAGEWNWKNSGDQEFIDTLLLAGTTFRFREDPDSVIYVVTGKKNCNSPDCDDGEYGKHHTWNESSDEGNGNNKKRWRIDFEKDGSPGVGFGAGPAGYNPIGSKKTTASPGVPELGYWGGRHRHPSWNLGTTTSLCGDTFNVPAPLGTLNSSGVAVNSCRVGTSGYTNNGETFSGQDQAKRWRVHASKFHHIEIVEPIEDEDGDWSSKNPAVWETEPKEDVGMDIYYEASPALPVRIDFKTNEMFAPYGSRVLADYGASFPSGTTIQAWSGDKVTLSNNVVIPGAGFRVAFERPDGFKSYAILQTPAGGSFPNTTNSFRVRGVPIAPNYTNNSYSDAPANQPVTLAWYNAIAFGNGIESDRIRDDYNQKTISNGVKASTVLAKPYNEERRKTGLIHSGIYNSTSGVNNLNQFIAAEKITKDMNPKYGSIQKLHTRDTNIVVMHEDKIMQVLADKDALFNADGKSNVAISSNFLGSDKPFATKYGISTNPESFATDLAGRVYFADRSRGAILRLSNSGVDNISDYGMKDWFNDHLNPYTDKILGSFDQKKGLYNISITGFTEDDIDSDGNNGDGEDDKCACKETGDGRADSLAASGGYGTSNITFFEKTLSFSENSKGWVSFKSFLPESGLSINNNYYTFKDGHIFRHHANKRRNYFYGEQYMSTANILFNDDPAAVKSFATLNYEGTKAFIPEYTEGLPFQSIDHKKLFGTSGWFVMDAKTDLQETDLLTFKKKEGKYFASIKGEVTTLGNLDQGEFSVQGIGLAETVSKHESEEEPAVTKCLTITPKIECDEVRGCMDGSASNFNPNATIDDGSCVFEGCTDPYANNYDPLANFENGSCTYDPEPVDGCMNPAASNYDASATNDDGSCVFPCSQVLKMVSTTYEDPTTVGPCSAGYCGGNGWIEWVVEGDFNGAGWTGVGGGNIVYAFNSAGSQHGPNTGILATQATLTGWTYDSVNNTSTLLWEGLGIDMQQNMGGYPEGYHMQFEDANGCVLPLQQVILTQQTPAAILPSCTNNGTQGVEAGNFAKTNGYSFDRTAAYGTGTMTKYGVAGNSGQAIVTSMFQDCYATGGKNHAQSVMSHSDFGLQNVQCNVEPYYWARTAGNYNFPLVAWQWQRLERWIIVLANGTKWPREVVDAFLDYNKIGTQAVFGANGDTLSPPSGLSTMVVGGDLQINHSNGVGMYGFLYSWKDVVSVLNDLIDSSGTPILQSNGTGGIWDENHDDVGDVFNKMGNRRFLMSSVACCNDPDPDEIVSFSDCLCPGEMSHLN